MYENLIIIVLVTGSIAVGLLYYNKFMKFSKKMIKKTDATSNMLKTIMH